MEISKRVKEVGLPSGKYVVVGGAMEAYGIRDAKDLDIVVTPDLFEDLIKQGWEVCMCDKCKESWSQGETKRILKRPGVDILSGYSWKDIYEANTDELIQNANVIDGVAFVQIEELLKWKKAARREKDLKDVELIEEFIKKN